MNSRRSFSVALALPPHRSALLRCMVDGAAQELRRRGIEWLVIDAAEAADVVFRQSDPLLGQGTPELYAEVARSGRLPERIRIDGPLRTTAVSVVLSRIARSFRPDAAKDGGSSVALRWLQELRALPGDTTLLGLVIGTRPVAVLDVPNALWHGLEGADVPDADLLLDRMAREGFRLTPVPAIHGATVTISAPLKPVLWQFALASGAAGLLPEVADGTLRLKGWPYLAAGGPRSFGDLIRRLRGTPLTAASLAALGFAPSAELQGFLNACHACGYLQISAPAASHVPLRRPTLHALPLAAANARREGRGGRVGSVIASIRRTLGIGAE